VGGSESSPFLAAVAGGKLNDNCRPVGCQAAVFFIPDAIDKKVIMPDFPAISHAAVTVSDLARSTHWYAALIGADPVLDEDEAKGAYHHTVWVLPGGQLFGIHAHQSGDGTAFDESSVGLDHLAFACTTRGELEQWAARLDELGITHSGIDDQHYGSGLSFRDPDGIALEFFAPPAT
jgi:glyoxylase I family protein